MDTVLSTSIDGSHVLVEVGVLASVLEERPLAIAAAALVVVVAALVVVVARPGTRAAVGFALPAAGIGAALAWSLATTRDVALTTVLGGLGPLLRRGDEVAVLGGAAVGAGLCLGVITLATAARRRAAAAVAGAAAAVVVAGAMPVWHLAVAREEVAAPLRAAWPLPSLTFAGQDPEAGPPLEVHVGRTRAEAPTFIGQLGKKSEPATTAMLKTWRLEGYTVALPATKAGPDEAIARLVASPVVVSTPVRFVGVRDAGPVGVALTPGHRQSWAEVTGRDGVVIDTEQRIQQAGLAKRRRLPSASTILAVLDERVAAGQRILRLQLSRGAALDTFDAIARDGVLYRRGEGGGLEVLVKDGAAGECEAPMLGYSQCRCSAAGIDRCVQSDTNTLGALGRMSLALLTLGLSEVTGACDDCGRGTERGLVRLP